MSKNMMIKTAVGIILAVCVIPPILMGGLWVEALRMIFTVLASYEIVTLAGEKNWPFTILLTVIIEIIAHIPAVQFAAAAAILLVILFVLVFVDEKVTVENAVYTFMLTMIVALGWQCAVRYYAEGNPGYGILLAGLACYVCDTGAYFFGVFTGKHKMIPRISPNKTWEGAIGGYLSGMLVSLIYGLSLCRFLPVSLIIASAILLPAAAEIGDLAFSSVKRHFGIKDFGSLIPGHGGVLDRIDSLLFVLMVFNALMIMWGIGI